MSAYGASQHDFETSPRLFIAYGLLGRRCGHSINRGQRQSKSVSFRNQEQMEINQQINQKVDRRPMSFIFQCPPAVLDLSCVSAVRDMYVFVPPGLSAAAALSVGNLCDAAAAIYTVAAHDTAGKNVYCLTLCIRSGITATICTAQESVSMKPVHQLCFASGPCVLPVLRYCM